MNFIEAMESLKSGEKIRNSNWTKDNYIELGDDGFFIKNKREYKCIWLAGIKDLDDDNWEIYKPKISDKEQWNLDAMKFRIINACRNNVADCYCCPMYENICENKSEPNKGYFDDWAKKEIIEAYKLLKEVE